MPGMRETTFGRGRAVAITAGGLSFLLLLALILASGTRGTVESGETQDVVPPVAAPTERTKELLAVFTQARTPRDAFFNDTSDGSTPIPMSDAVPGENPGLARRADVPGTGGPIYLWPTQDGACWSVEGMSSCGTNSQISRLGVLPSLTVGRPGLEGLSQVAGIAKDGVSEVTVALANGETVKATVNRNAFLVDVNGTAAEVRWTEGDQARSVPLPKIQPPVGGEIREGLVRSKP